MSGFRGYWATPPRPRWAVPPSCKERSRERPLRKARLYTPGPISGGGAPARQSVRPLFAGRTARIANPLPDKALARLRVLRPRRTEGFLGGPNVLRRGIFPATTVRWCCAGPRGAGEGTMTARTGVLVMAGKVAWYLLPRSAPESPFTRFPFPTIQPRSARADGQDWYKVLSSSQHLRDTRPRPASVPDAD